MIAPDDPRHGKPAGYAARCREQCCIRAMRRYQIECALDGQPRELPAVGTVRRVRALAALGWNWSEIAAAGGFGHGKYVWQLATRVPLETYTYRLTRQRTLAAYDALSMGTPEGKWAETHRRRAAERGWAPPLAWDDDTIDDPQARPAGIVPPRYESGAVDEVAVLRAINGDHTVKLNIAEGEEAIRVLNRRGMSDTDIARTLGRPHRSVQRTRGRLGLPAIEPKPRDGYAVAS